MKVNKQILILLIFNLFPFLTLQMLFAQNANNESEYIGTVKTDEKEESEIDKMAEELEKERKELLKLKSEFDKITEEGKTKNKVIQSTTTTDTGEDDGGNRETLDNEIQDTYTTTEIGDENIATLDKKANGVKEGFSLNEEDISKIINPFEIAENLYKLGEYETALDIYKILAKDNTENNKGLWITFQIANCYRKTKTYDKALGFYREILNENEGTYWAKQAQWYINEIGWQTEVQNKLETIKEK